jgi:glutaredoxin
MPWKSSPSSQLPPALWAIFLVLSALLGSASCRRDVGSDSEPGALDVDSHEPAGAHPELAKPALIKPPFDVSGELDGLLLVWFDADGLHTAQKRSEIPDAQRASVRVDSLNVEPDARLDPEHVYVADLRNAGSDGHYPVQKASRTWFDAQVDRAKPQAPAIDENSVVVYKASWCGACKSAAAYLRSRKVSFVEKDVEKEPGASEEMQRKAQAKGLRPRGVPVIDFRGEIMLGFDQARLSDLIDRAASSSSKAI